MGAQTGRLVISPGCGERRLNDADTVVIKATCTAICRPLTPAGTGHHLPAVSRNTVALSSGLVPRRHRSTIAFATAYLTVAVTRQSAAIPSRV
jgi:hypothetical protein